MDQKFTVFDYRFNDEELENEFNKFFNKNDLSVLFTNEHRVSNISVTYIDAKSIVNQNGKYHKLFIKLQGYLKIAQDNKSFEEAVFKILYKSNSFQGLARNAKKVINFIDNLPADYLFNTWNIVWYTKDVY